jgi:hypothetical protein
LLARATGMTSFCTKSKKYTWADLWTIVELQI